MSMARHEYVYLATDGMWYVELGEYEYHYNEDRDPFDRAGPFTTQEKAEDYVSQFSNTGGGYLDDRGVVPPPA